MRILDEQGNELETYDNTKGYLVNDKVLIARHEAVEAVEEQGHFETIAEYPNGGKDVEWVVDTLGVEAAEAWDEYEDIYRYIPYTAAELAEMRIGVLKQHLFDTDYNILKVVEGAMTLADCSDVLKKRAAWRKEINELEKVVGADGS